MFPVRETGSYSLIGDPSKWHLVHQTLMRTKPVERMICMTPKSVIYRIDPRLDHFILVRHGETKIYTLVVPRTGFYRWGRRRCGEDYWRFVQSVTCTSRPLSFTYLSSCVSDSQSLRFDGLMTTNKGFGEVGKLVSKFKWNLRHRETMYTPPSVERPL